MALKQVYLVLESIVSSVEKDIPDVGVHRLIHWEKDVPLVDTLATVLPE